MRLIRKNVEREAEGSAAEKLISDGFTPMKEATSDTIPEEKIGKDIEDMTVEELKRERTDRCILPGKSGPSGNPERVIRWHQQKISKS